MGPHFIAMSGLHGCLPDNCATYDSRADAAQSLIDLFELNPARKADYDIEFSIRDAGYAELRAEHGAQYCEIVECNCDHPENHES